VWGCPDQVTSLGATRRPHASKTWCDDPQLHAVLQSGPGAENDPMMLLGNTGMVR
jgi:hypothetical protein